MTASALKPEAADPMTVGMSDKARERHDWMMRELRALDAKLADKTPKPYVAPPAGTFTLAWAVLGAGVYSTPQPRDDDPFTQEANGTLRAVNGSVA